MQTWSKSASPARTARAWILVALVPVLGMAVTAVTACTEDKPTPPAAASATTTTTAAAPASAAPPPSAAAPEPSASAPLLPAREIAGAQQVLVAYKGADLAPKEVTRTKEAAKKRAEEALAKIKKDNMPFEDAAKKYSDDAGSKDVGGAIGNFERNAMPEAFSKATFDMKVGDVSDVVETPRGFHIIKRTK